MTRTPRCSLAGRDSLGGPVSAREELAHAAAAAAEAGAEAGA